jgi:hypothetical protein
VTGTSPGPRAAWLVATVGWLALAGCLKAIGPDVGPPQSPPDAAAVADGSLDGSLIDGNSACGDSNPAATVSFATDLLGGVFTKRGCVKCHTGGGQGVQQSGFSLASYATLRTGGGRSGANIVVDFMPCQSVLAQKISPAPPFGRRMPYNGPPYLSAAELQLVTDWIAEGAHDN